MMIRKTELVLLMMPLSVLMAGGVRGGEAEALWEAHVRPMVDEQCVKCHGPIEEKKQVWETGVWVLESSGCVGGLGGGWSWSQVANGAKTGADIEMGNTGSVGAAARGAVKKAKLAK